METSPLKASTGSWRANGIMLHFISSLRKLRITFLSLVSCYRIIWIFQCMHSQHVITLFYFFYIKLINALNFTSPCSVYIKSTTTLQMKATRRHNSTLALALWFLLPCSCLYNDLVRSFFEIEKRIQHVWTCSTWWYWFKLLQSLKRSCHSSWNTSPPCHSLSQMHILSWQKPLSGYPQSAMQ